MPWRLILECLHLILVVIILDVLPFGLKSMGIAAAVAWLVTIRIEAKAKILLDISIILSFLLLNLAAPLFMEKTYYRPHEKLKKINTGKFKKYAANQNAVVEKGHGDLVAIGFSHPEVNSIKEERKLEFSTDENGYRNSPTQSSIYSAILVGDSFVVGNSNSQADILSEQLLQKGIHTYNLGHNGDIAEYFYSLEHYRKDHAQKVPAILFMFEGNDFYKLNYCMESESLVGGVRTWHRMIKELHLARFLEAIWAQFSSRKEEAAKAIRIVQDPETKKKIGFLEDYIQVAQKNDYNSQCLQNLLQNKAKDKNIIAIYFIPEKSRVYHFLLPELPGRIHQKSIYSEEVEKISKEIGIPFFDLTEVLREKAKQSLKTGEFIFWRDDTHWNKSGIAVAADAVEKLLIQKK